MQNHRFTLGLLVQKDGLNLVEQLSISRSTTKLHIIPIFGSFLRDVPTLHRSVRRHHCDEVHENLANHRLVIVGVQGRQARCGLCRFEANFHTLAKARSR